MTSKREWRKRALELGEALTVQINLKWGARAERDAAVAERDRARATACALEADYAALVEYVALADRNVSIIAEAEDVSLAEAARAVSLALVTQVEPLAASS